VIEVPEVWGKEYRAHEEKYFHNDVGSLTTTQRGVKDRIQEVLEALKISNLNPEERRVMEETYRDYQDIFYLPGDKLSCTTNVKHPISVVQGTSPIHTGPYRLLESQKAEI
jgi:hypothetical protein